MTGLPLLAAGACVFLSCATATVPQGRSADDLLIVDCMLPGRVRQLGTSLTYLEPRRPIKTTGRDCAIRGGEYTANDRASYATALRVWLPVAERGDPEAQTYVGEIYEKGRGLAPDYEAAALWYRRAAEQGYAPAQINLGQLYEKGRGVPRDPEIALDWYRRASGLEGRVAFVPSGATEPAGAADELQRLRRELSERSREAEQLREELRELQQQDLEGADRGEIDRGQEELTNLDAEIGSVREKRDREAAVAREEMARLEAEIERLREQAERLTAEQKEFERNRGEAERLKTEMARLQAPAPVKATVAMAGPTIEMLEPRVPRTRGFSVVRTMSVDPERVLVGRVVSPAGLLTLTVNDAETAVTDSGIFETRVKLATTGAVVKIVAVDRRGKTDRFEFKLGPSEGAEDVASPPPPRRSIDFGKYYALIVGNNEYRHLPKLVSARDDARLVSEVLERRYGFEVKTLYDADRYQTMKALNELRKKLSSDDNLLIYYAGHGELDRANMRGNWLPVDAEPDSTANWISNVSLTDILNSMNARHILVIADSCYSGTLTRASLARLEAGSTDAERWSWVEQMVAKRSRTALTSGGLAPVLDGGSKSGNSVFAAALLKILEENEEVIEGQRLYLSVAALVAHAAQQKRFEQLPQYAPIKHGGHASGDFFFAPATRSRSDAGGDTAWASAVSVDPPSRSR